MFLFQLHSRAVGNDLGSTLHHSRGTEPDIDDGIGTHGIGFVHHPLGGDKPSTKGKVKQQFQRIVKNSATLLWHCSC